MTKYLLIICFLRWLFGITSNHNYIISRSNIKYREGSTLIDTLINVDGYYHGSDMTDNIIFYRDGTFAHNVNIKKDSLSGATKYLFMPNGGGIYTVRNDTIIAHVYTKTGVCRYWRLSEYKYVIKERNRIEQVSRELIGARPNRSELFQKRQVYRYCHADSIPLFGKEWKKKQWLWENKDDMNGDR